MMLCGAVRAIFVLPVTAGNVTRIEGDTPKHDGRISVCLIGVILLAIIFAFIFVLDSKETHFFRSTELKCIMIVLSLLSVASIVYLSVIGFRRISNGSMDKRSTKDRAARLNIIFLWVFGICLLINSSLNIISGSEVSCTLAHSTVDKVYFSCLFISVLFQLLFILCYNKYQFPLEILVHYCMVILCTFNMSIWFYDVTGELFEQTNSTDVLSTGNFSGCEFEKVIKKLKPILSPAVLENFLMSVSFLFVMWDPNRTQEEQGRRAMVSTGYGSITRSRSSTEMSSVSIGVDLKFSTTLLGGFTLVTITSIGYIIYTTENTLEFYEGLEIFQSVFKMIWTLSLLVAFYQLSTQCCPKRESESLKVGDFILIFSAFGLMLFHQFGLLSGFPTEVGIYVVIDNIFNICIVYLQTVFILQCERYQRKDDYGGNWPITNICILLSLLNGGYWFIDSFFHTAHPELFIVQSAFYSPRLWNIIIRTVFPLGIFYRFHSATILFSIYSRFKVTNTK